jgi:hypothetical protein
MKGLHVSVLRYAYNYDSSLNGITAQADSILLVDEKLEGGLYEPEPDEIYLKLVRRKIRAGEPDYIHAEPYKNGKKLHGGAWSMFGGNYVHSCDSRITALNRYPIPVHDRFENL